MLLFLLSLFLFSSTVQGKGYTVVVKTSGDSWAGTDATVKIIVQGTIRQIYRTLPGSHQHFEPGKTDTFSFEDYDIGRVRGMVVSRDDAGLFSNWKLDWIKIKIAGAPDSIFEYYGWVGAYQLTSLRLSCSQGYKVNSQGYCDDLDECSLGTHSCDQKCINTLGSFKCQCVAGYESASQHKCQDIDECLTGLHSCDLFTSTCVNTLGSYICQCRPGYEIISQDKCQDLDECALGRHSCDVGTSICVNTLGSYTCRCRPGYEKISQDKCQAISCRPLAGPTGSILEPARCTQADANVYRDRCVMKCKVGYVISDSSHGTLTCGSSGMWEGTMGTCNVKLCSANEPLGMENGKISNQSITASSYYANYPPWSARLNAAISKSWYAKPHDPTPWIQVDLGKSTWVKGIATQGKAFTMYVKSYKLAYSPDQLTWFPYRGNDGIEKIFNGNTEPYGAVKNNLEKPVYTRYVRVYPVSWNHALALKLELYGCVNS